VGLSWQDLWNGPDKGLILCWERGRHLASTSPELSTKALSGELPVLGWKGGIARKLKKTEKFGSLKYLAQWQGLRGDDLSISLSKETILTCSRTGTIVTFTSDIKKYQN
jgi:hypothetical protein